MGNPKSLFCGKQKFKWVVTSEQKKPVLKELGKKNNMLEKYLGLKSYVLPIRRLWKQKEAFVVLKLHAGAAVLNRRNLSIPITLTIEKEKSSIQQEHLNFIFVSGIIFQSLI